jgi:pyruvate dehydrogenase E1 component beta subunit
MRRDPAVFVMGRHITRDGGAYTANHGLLEEFGPRRVVDTPPLSQTLAGVAIGAAINGLRPVVEVTSWNAALPTLSLIVDTAAKLQLMSGAELTVPLVVRGPDGAYPGCGAQHAQSLAAWLAHVPGLKVVAPADPADAKGLLKAAIRDDGPVLILESEALYETEGAVPSDSDHVVALGRARIVRRGTDITIATFGRSVALALAAADQLADEGIAVEVVDLRSLRPLDVETVVASVRSTHRLLTLEDGWPVCSIGAEICATVASAAFDALSAPPQRIAGEDMAMPYAASLARRALPDKDMLIAAVRRLCHVDR